MFEFVDYTSGKQGKFISGTTNWGFAFTTGTTDQKCARWGKVITAGPTAGVMPGEYILVESLMWMEGTKIGKQKMWKTDDSKILAVTTDIRECTSQDS